MLLVEHHSLRKFGEIATKGMTPSEKCVYKYARKIHKQFLAGTIKSEFRLPPCAELIDLVSGEEI